MAMTDVYKNIITYNPLADVNSDYKEINESVKQCLENGTMPYNFDKPFPPNINIISGKRACADLNIDKIELKARAIGATNTMWIYGADAQYLGLELKSTNPQEFMKAKELNKNFNCKPLTIQLSRERLFGNPDADDRTNGLNESLCIDKQCVYLLDQFTSESVNRLFDEKKLRSKLNTYSKEDIDRVNSLVKEFVSNRYRYDENLEREEVAPGQYVVETPEKRNERLNLEKNNLAFNLNKSSYIFKQVIDARQEKFYNYLPAQKVLFDFSYKHHNNQSCPIGNSVLHRFSPDQRKSLDEAFKSLINLAEKESKKVGIITRTLFDGFAFSQRLTHYNFSLEPILSKEDTKKKEFNLSKMPKAYSQNKQKDNSILDDKAKKKLQQRTFSMHVGQDMGM